MGNIVRKANSFITAAHRLTVQEQRIILCAISKVKPMCEVSDDVLYRVSTQDLVAAGVDNKDASNVLHTALQQLFNREVTVMASDGMNINTRWIQAKREPIKANESWIELRFTKDLLPYLTNLSSEFTQYALRDAVSLNSAYSMRIFEIVMQNKSIGSRLISVAELRKILMVEDKHLVFSDFRKRVIESSIKQINKKTSINIHCEYIRTGRKITDINFVFDWSKKGHINKTKEKPVYLEMTIKQRAYFASLISELPSISKLAPAGLSGKQFIEWLTKELEKPEQVEKWKKELKQKGYVPTEKKKTVTEESVEKKSNQKTLEDEDAKTKLAAHTEESVEKKSNQKTLEDEDAKTKLAAQKKSGAVQSALLKAAFNLNKSK